jgi:hypothetical protein
MSPAQTAPPVLSPVPDDTLRSATPAPGSLVEAIRDDPDALVYFLLNVGDGDTQLLLLPPDSHQIRRLMVVDVATPGKLPPLLDRLHAESLIEPPGSAGQVRLLSSTHPHYDHTGGMLELFDLYGGELGPIGWIEQFWEPGYWFPNPTFHTLMARLEDSPWIRRLQPTAGTTLYLGQVRITVLGPSVALRTRFDTYGVGINDASITLMIEFPATAIYAEPDPQNPDRKNRRQVRERSWRLLLGADAQFASWAQTISDFPDLKDQYNPQLAAELRTAIGPDYLHADILKVSHHASKHGVNIEFLERVGARLSLISSVDGGGKYHFPHALAMEAAREAAQPTTTSHAQRKADHLLGLHVTGSHLVSGPPAGSIALLIPHGSGSLRMFRLMDEPGAAIDLTQSREISL